MRLAQAARKLSITTEDIVDFLEIRGVTIEKDSNTKLDEEAVKMLYRYFEIEEEESKVDDESESVFDEGATAKVTEEEIPEIVEDEEPEIEEEIEEGVVSKKTGEEEAVEEREQISGQEQSDEPKKKSFRTVDELLEGEEGTDEDFVIKPAKVELKGLNVLGKIDLPEPSPKPESKEKSKVRKPTKAELKTQANRTPRRKQKRELTPTEIRKREEQKEARKREQIEREKKKKREQFYKEKILKPKQIEQKNRPSKRKATTERTPSEQKPRPKTVLGKFWKWLNT